MEVDFGRIRSAYQASFQRHLQNSAMTFLNSLFLLALPLIAVPLVLHFLKRRERKVVQWGAMRFLHEATTDSRRMRLPESLLLLLARCLLVAGIVFALARPLIHWGGSSAVADRELIVIVDDSLSTARRSDGEPVFNRIRSAAEEVIAASPTNLPFQILRASGGGRWIGDQPHTPVSPVRPTAPDPADRYCDRWNDTRLVRQ